MKEEIALSFFLIILVITIDLPSQNNQTSSCYRCNVVLISLDSLRADHLGIYGYSRDTSPNIDNLAREGIVFKNYISNSYLTPISEASLQTSLYPSFHNTLSFAHELEFPNDTIKSYLTIAQILKIYNYKTAAYSTSPEISADRQFPAFHYGFDSFNKRRIRTLPEFENVSGWLENNTNSSFFLYLALGTIHEPFAKNVPPEIKSKFDPKDYDGPLKNISLDLDYELFSRIYNRTFYNITANESITTMNVSNISVSYAFFEDTLMYDSRNPGFNLDDQDVAYINARYDAGIFYVDQYLGKLFNKLKELGLENNTIIIIESEHGEGLGEHGYFWHYDIYDTEIHSPLIIKNPGIPGGKVIDAQVQGIDILPTILDFLNIEIPTQAQGKSIKPLLGNYPPQDFNKYVFLERPLWEERYSLAPDEDFAVRTNEWKLIYRQSRNVSENISMWGRVINETIPIPEFELYNLKTDPYEQNNLIGKEPQVADELKEKLFEWLAFINSGKKHTQTIENRTLIFPYP